MEFHQKLQELRKRQGLTQEELAAALYVSRTAVSKWESGRGYPNIDSLRAIAKHFGVTIDELLSSDEVLTIAEKDQQQKAARFLDQVVGLLDLSAAMFFVLPLFGQRTEGVIQSVALPMLTEIQPYLKTVYFAVLIGMLLLGAVTLALQQVQQVYWVKWKTKISLLLNAAGVFLFIVSSQPYAAAVLFLFLLIKLLMCSKKR